MSMKNTLTKSLIKGARPTSVFFKTQSQFESGDWQDEFRASYDAAVNAPNLSDAYIRCI